MTDEHLPLLLPLLLLMSCLSCGIMGLGEENPCNATKITRIVTERVNSSKEPYFVTKRVTFRPRCCKADPSKVCLSKPTDEPAVEEDGKDTGSIVAIVLGSVVMIGVYGFVATKIVNHLLKRNSISAETEIGNMDIENTDIGTADDYTGRVTSSSKGESQGSIYIRRIYTITEGDERQTRTQSSIGKRMILKPETSGYADHQQPFLHHKSYKTARVENTD